MTPLSPSGEWSYCTRGHCPSFLGLTVVLTFHPAPPPACVPHAPGCLAGGETWPSVPSGSHATLYRDLAGHSERWTLRLVRQDTGSHSATWRAQQMIHLLKKITRISNFYANFSTLQVIGRKSSVELVTE